MTYIDSLGRTHVLASRRHLAVAMYLDAMGTEWHYCDMVVPYVDMLTGEHKQHQIDFTIIDRENVTWLEARPAKRMIPNDARIYASRRAEEAEITYRGLRPDELAMANWLLGIGFRADKVQT